ncbi:MAG: MarR family transcriptional regulator [Thermoplasmata archaeon]|nr:MarR family transcriptional regulator [Thermoplasmata archaeon]NIT76048.1 MarR family transcriptional regulator [Thermoplasmata archaeon]NIV77781.1 MarR family transcriptional regulator [Thermoplasmata archaeon]NIY02419.1 MarR family transcriptional regulator [Thermoplasmata archaeon]
MSAKKGEVDNTIEALASTGMPKGIARTLAYLSSKENWATSKDIEKATRLRQPEVSIAVRDLEDRGWVERDSLKRESKGRPINIYRMSVDLDQVYSAIESDEKLKIRRVETNLRNIRELWSLS